MTDYISREVAIEAIGEMPLNWTDSPEELQEVADWEEHLHAIMAVPAADVRPVRWIPVTERLPEEKHAVLAWEPKYLNTYVCLLSDGDWFVFGGYGVKVFGITHWMPLPEPPKEDDHD